MSEVLVLGSGIVGSAAAWDLVRRGHEVTVADREVAAAEAASGVSGARPQQLDATDSEALRGALETAALVVCALPYEMGVAMARAAVDSSTHYVDFGGNPTIVDRQLLLAEDAADAGVTIVPDCGLAPGMANVLAVGAVAALGEGPIEEVRIRVGALPTEPIGAMKYQRMFNPVGLINEYAEPGDILANGEHRKSEPLTGCEEVDWPGWGPLEAFHTGGGSSSLPRIWEGRVASLDYKTLRYPGHRRIFRAMSELGLFSESPQQQSGVPPRRVLLEALAENLPSGREDVVLVRVWATAERGGEMRRAGYQIEDRHDGRFSALARTTAFPTTALADYILSGRGGTGGALTMDHAIPAEVMIEELDATDLEVADYVP